MGKGLTYALAAWLLLAPTAATAQVEADGQARIHFQAGTNYYQVADYEAALREYARAYELTERPQLLYNVYLCHERLGHLAEAIDFLERYLGAGLEVQNGATLEARLATMRRRQEAATEAERLATMRRRQEAATEAERLAAEQLAAEQAVSAAETNPGPIEAPQTTPETPTPESGEDAMRAIAEDDPRPQNAASGSGIGAPAVVAFVTAGVGLAAFAVAGGLALGEDSSLEDHCAGTCVSSETNKLQSLMLAADVSLGVAVVAGTIGLVFALMNGADEEVPPVAWAPYVTPDGAGASARVVF